MQIFFIEFLIENFFCLAKLYFRCRFKEIECEMSNKEFISTGKMSRYINSKLDNHEDNILCDNEPTQGINESKLNIENIDSYFINNLNSEFINLGLDSIYSSNNKSSTCYNVLFSNMMEIINRYNRQMAIQDRVNEE